MTAGRGVRTVGGGMAGTDEFLFVYGTLRQGAKHPMHGVVARYAVPVGRATFQGRLYDLGGYPAAVPSEDVQDQVVGEVYRLRDAFEMLVRLDIYEACEPGREEPTEYVRRRESVRLDSGSVLEAWMYVYNLPVSALPRITSGDFLRR